MLLAQRTVFLQSVFCITAAAISVANAGNVTLKNEHNNVTIQGELLKYDGKKFVIQSAYFGKMTINSRHYNCTEGHCPKQLTKKTTAGQIHRLGIAGSYIIGAELMPALIEAHARTIGASTKRIFSKDPQHLRVHIVDALGLNLAAINLSTRGSKTSFPALVKGNAQIALYSQSTKKEQAKKLRKNDREHILALDGIQVIVSPRNPINALSLKQIAQIFSGKINNWSQVGGASGKINIYAPGRTSGIGNVFHDLVLKPHRYTLKGSTKSFISSIELADAVAKDRYAIGFTSIAYKRNAKPVAVSTECSAAKFPREFDIKTEEYPLSFRHYLYAKSHRSSPYAKKLVNFALSSKAQKTIRKHGFIDLTPASLNFNNQADRIITGVAATTKDFNVTLINQFNKMFSDADRLSVTFRFDEAGKTLDHRSVADLKYASRLFQSRKYRNKSIYLVGFTDSTGSTDQNIVLSLSRADKVKSAIISASGGKIKPYRLHVRGYGELLPVACNSTKAGRYKNRRVEVWIK